MFNFYNSIYHPRLKVSLPRGHMDGTFWTSRFTEPTRRFQLSGASLDVVVAGFQQVSGRVVCPTLQVPYPTAWPPRTRPSSQGINCAADFESVDHLCGPHGLLVQGLYEMH